MPIHAASDQQVPTQLHVRTVDVAGIDTRYVDEGAADGGPVKAPPLLFLHGWGLGATAYARPLRRLIRRGVRVVAPSLPGLGGSGDLSGDVWSMEEYGQWAAAFLDAIGVDGPVMVMGHSLGGAVGISLARKHRDRVQYLILLNAVGGARWSGMVGDSVPLSGRPAWNWGLHLAREVVQASTDVRALRAMVPQLAANVVRNPTGLIRSARLARGANLSGELAALRRSDLPVLALTSRRDGVIPRAAFDALCAAIGTDGHVVEGRHTWLLSDPDSMPAVLNNVLDVGVADHRAAANTTRLGVLRGLLSSTPMPDAEREELLDEASPLWLMSEDERTLAGDLALCTPALLPGEVRAVVRAVADSDLTRLTVVAADRPGLLADTAGILAGEGLSIRTATAVTWPRLGLAMHSVTIEPDELFTLDRWDIIGDRLRDTAAVPAVPPMLRPSAVVNVTCHGELESRALLTVEADDQLGLLATICRWVNKQGATIESVGATTDAGRATDSFVIRGQVRPDDLADLLRRAPRLPRRRSIAVH